MKIDRYKSRASGPIRDRAVPAARRPSPRRFCLARRRVLTLVTGAVVTGVAASPFSADIVAATEQRSADDTKAAADALFTRILRQLAFGPAFHAKVRKRVRAAGKEVIGVGSYEQAGNATGQYHLQITMHDGVGKHTLQQISDGRLAWTRIQIADDITLKRINLGTLREARAEPTRQQPLWRRFERQRLSVPGEPGSGTAVHPSLSGGTGGSVPLEFCVGGLTELLATSHRDYDLRISGGTLEGRPVWILAGDIRDAARNRVTAHAGGGEWPDLCPTRIRIAVARQHDETTGFGEGLPVRIEFRGEPAPERDDAAPVSRDLGPLIGLLELYSIQQIAQPPAARFKFANDDAAIQFTDETERYLPR